MRLKRYLKLIIGILISWILVIVSGLILSRSMQDKIIQILSEQADKYILSEIHIRKNDIHFSIFKKFPTASIELRNIYIKIPPAVNLSEAKPIKGDTLLYAKSVYLQLNLLSLLSDRYELQKISVNDGYIQLVSDKKGNSSLSIIRKTPDKKASKLVADINAFSVSNLTVYTADISKKTRSTVYLSEGNASGTFASANFSVKLKTSGKIKNFETNKQRLEPLQDFAIEVEVENLKNNYAIKKGYFNISNIPFKVIGNIRSGDNLLVDLIFSANKVPLKKIDQALLQGLIGKSGIELRAGTIDIQSTIIGNTRYSLPAIKATYRITNGKIFDNKYQVLLEKIYLEGNADNGKEHLLKSVTLRVDTLNFQLGESIQSGKLKIQSLIDPKIAVFLNGHIYIDDIKSFVSVKNISLHKGEFHNNLAFAASFSKKAETKDSFFKDIDARAKIDIRELEVEFEKLNIPRTTINGKVELTTMNTLKIDKIICKSANSDITIDGLLTDFNADNSYPHFNGTISSKEFHADDFINQSTSSSEPISFPDSIRISGILEVTDFYFGKFESHTALADIDYNNTFLKVNSYTMNGFEGKIQGKLTLNQNKKGDIELFTDANLENVNINKLFIGCNNFNQDIIGSQHLDGSITGHVIFNTSWSNTLDFIPSSVIAQSEFVISNGEIKNYDPLLGLSDYINVEELKDIKFDKLEANVVINNQQVFLDQTHIISSAITFDASGIHDFDNKYEYRLQLGLSDLLWKKAKKKNTEITEFGYVRDDGVGHTTIPLIISGKGTTFEVKYDKKTARNKFKDKLEAEKLELRELFNKEDNVANKLESNNMNTTTGGEPPKLEKTDSGKYRTVSDDFIIEWDDSEESDEEN